MNRKITLISGGAEFNDCLRHFSALTASPFTRQYKAEAVDKDQCTPILSKS